MHAILVLPPKTSVWTPQCAAFTLLKAAQAAPGVAQTFIPRKHPTVASVHELFVYTVVVCAQSWSLLYPNLCSTEEAFLAVGIPEPLCGPKIAPCKFAILSKFGAALTLVLTQSASFPKFLFCTLSLSKYGSNYGSLVSSDELLSKLYRHTS